MATDLIRMRTADPDANAAWTDRMDELRNFFEKLAKSLKRDGALAEGWTPRKAADFIWSSCHVLYWDLLVKECGWPAKNADALIRDRIAKALLKSD